MNANAVIEMVKESKLWEPLTEEQKNELITNHVVTGSQPSMTKEVTEIVRDSDPWKPLSEEEKKELITNHLLTR